MKILSKKIDMLALFITGKPPQPIRFRVNDENGNKTIKVDKVISIEKKKSGGSPLFLYLCQSIIGGVMKQYELKYKILDCKWELYKM